jgi:23S rRNA (guanosine2251-2'-O)-methyltransferase
MAVEDSKGAQLEGRQPVREALLANRPINKLFLAKGAKDLGPILDLARERGVVVEWTHRAKLDKLSGGRIHQGVIAQVAPYHYAELEDLLTAEEPLLLILDGIEDPHNLGSLLRTAESVGASGAVIPKRRAAPITPTVEKAASGALAHLPVARVSNLAQTIDALKEHGLWVVGCDMDGEQTLWEADLTGSLAVVVGSEGSGVSRLVKEKCDFIVRLPMLGKISSLNASVAGGIVLYEVLRQRLAKKG